MHSGRWNHRGSHDRRNWWLRSRRTLAMDAGDTAAISAGSCTDSYEHAHTYSDINAHSNTHKHTNLNSNPLAYKHAIANFNAYGDTHKHTNLNSNPYALSHFNWNTYGHATPYGNASAYSDAFCVWSR